MSCASIGLVDWRLPVSGPDAVLLAAHLGAEGIQMDLGGPKRAPWLDEKMRLQSVYKALVQTRISPLAISANILNDIGLTAVEGTLLADEVKKVIIRALNVAVELGVSLVFLPSFRRSAIYSPLTFSRTVEVLQWACENAHIRGLLLATENVLAPKKLLQLIESVNSCNLRVVLDTGNPLSAGLNPVEILKTAADFLATQVHIKKHNEQTSLNEDDTVVKNIFGELNRINFATEAFVLENDYRNGDLNRILSDIKWVRGFFYKG